MENQIMTRFVSFSLPAIIGITLVGLVDATAQAQVFGTDGRSGVYVQGNGQGMAGTFDESGFHGIAVGPNGKVQRFSGDSSTRFQNGGTGVVRNGAKTFSGAMTGGTAIGPGGFDPFAFVFGHSAPMAGGGVAAFAGPSPDQELADAKRALRQGRYEDVIGIVERVMNGSRGGVEAAQIRALALFAMQKYDQAAADAYRVLQSEAAWDWQALRQMCASRPIYVQQLRSLQAAAAQPMASAGVHFLLAYHCLMLDQSDAARAELVKTKQLQPENRLVDHLLASLPPSLAGP
jgi:hypothetical protein